MSAAKAYYTAQELADLSLPGMPTSKRRINEKANRENWDFRAREGRGGGREYPLDALPQAVRIFIAQTSNLKAAKTALKEERAADVSNDQLRDSRCYILEDIERFAWTGALSLNRATNIYFEMYNERTVSVPDWVWQSVPKISARTVRGWFKKRNDKGVEALSDAKRGPQGKSLFDLDKNLQLFVQAQITARPHIKATVLLKGIKASDHNFANTPSLRYLQQYILDWKKDNMRTLLAVSNPDAYRSKYEPAFGSLSAKLTRVNQLWEVDGTIADLMCISPSGENIRYSLTGMIDVYSRRTKVLVSRQPSAVAVGLLIRKCILDWGIPEVLKADNGKDYTAQYVNRIKDDLGFAINYCTPFRPMEKPHIERFFGTMTRDLFEILPGYVGHDVNDRKAIESRKAFGERFGGASTFKVVINGGELQHIIDAWIEEDYEVRNHSGVKTTPFLKAQQGGQPLRIADERALDLLLASSPGKDGIRVVQKSGISVNARTYIAAELGGIIGDHVHVKFDPEDEAKIMVYTGDRRTFICVAEDPTLSDLDRQAIAKRAKQAQHQENKVFKAEMKTAHEAHDPDQLAASILADKAAQKGKSKVLPFRPAEATPQTPAFVRERKAVAAMSPSPLPQPIITEEIQENVEREFALIDSAHAEPETVWLSREDGSQRPQFDNDFRFIAWMQEQPEIHPEDVTDLHDYLTNGSGRLDSGVKQQLAQRGVETFVVQLFKDMTQ